MSEFFSQAEQLISQDAARFLSLFCEETSHRQGLISKEELMPLWRKMDERNFYRADIPRVALIGQFKAGKSTLLNALLGHREYAASDFLEMTSWIARYWPSEQDFCNIVMNNGDIERCTPASFYERCQQRTFSERQLQSISRVDIGVTNLKKQVSWIDCPGLGSVNRANEKRMIEALEEADLLLWVVDCESTGNIADTQLIKHKIKQGMPCWIVLTKADLIHDSEELEELLEEISLEMEVPKKRIFATSAKQELEALEHYKHAPKNTGIEQLWEALGDIQIHALNLRSKAENSHRHALFEQILYLLEKTKQTLSQAKEGLNSYENWLLDLKESVLFDLKHESEMYARENIFGKKRPSLFEALTKILSKENKGDISYEISTAIRDILDPQHLEQFWNQMSAYMLDQIRHLWKKKILQGEDTFQRISAHFDSDVWKKTSFSPDIKDLSPYLLQQNNFDLNDSVLTSLGIAGAATAYAAWLGPLAAKISIGAATTGIGIPLAATGIALSFLLHKLLNTPQNKPEYFAAQVIEQYEEQFLENMIRKHFYTEMLVIQEHIAENLKIVFEEQVRERLPKQEKLIPLFDRCEDLLQKVQRTLEKTKREFGVDQTHPTETPPKASNANIARDALDQFETSFPLSTKQALAPKWSGMGGQESRFGQTSWSGHTYESFLDGRFVITELLGEGGMGLVFLCEDLLTKQHLALKSIRLEISQKKNFQESFWREVAISRSLSHPNIIRCYDLHYDKQQECYFFTMEYVEGQDFGKILNNTIRAKSTFSFEWQNTAKIFLEIIEALKYAHASGVIHRDLKPSNVMRSLSGQVKIGDFGVSKTFRNETTRHTGNIGTAFYVAPEQLDAGAIATPAVDIFSLGVLAYQLTTGKLPHVLLAPPSDICQNIPASLSRVIMQSMASNPDERPSLQEFSDVCESVLVSKKP